MDTVWIELTVVNNGPEHSGFFMFGPSGVTRFAQMGDRTQLIDSMSNVVSEVTEDAVFIMKTIGRIRKTLETRDEQATKTAARKMAKPARSKAKKAKKNSN